MFKSLYLHLAKKAMTYNDTASEQLFFRAGTLIHLHTQPLEDDVLWRGNDEFNVILNYIAVGLMHTRCRLLAFAIMSNHIHLILEGEMHDIEALFDKFLELLENYYRYNGKKTDRKSTRLNSSHH